MRSTRGQRDDHGPTGAGRGAERHRVRGAGLRVQGEAGRDGGPGDHVVLQQQPEPGVPMDTGAASADHRTVAGPHPTGLHGAHGRRAGQVPRAVHRPADHRADRQLQVRRVHVHRRGLHDQEDDGLR